MFTDQNKRACELLAVHQKSIIETIKNNQNKTIKNMKKGEFSVIEIKNSYVTEPCYVG